MEGGSLTITWPINIPLESHLDVVPELLVWTNWDGDEAWYNLCNQVASSLRTGGPPLCSAGPRLDHLFPTTSNPAHAFFSFARRA